MLAGVSGQLLHRLQVIQNAAARLVTGVRKYERMMLVLHSLHYYYYYYYYYKSTDYSDASLKLQGHVTYQI